VKKHGHCHRHHRQGDPRVGLELSLAKTVLSDIHPSKQVLPRRYQLIHRPAMSSTQPYVLVTGATGFIGAHVVDNLLERGIKVRAATRSLKKGEILKQARPQYASQLDIVQVGEFSEAASFEDAIKNVTGVIHVASPFSYSVQDNEKELVRPAIAGVRAILEAAASTPIVRRIVITSSFASVIDVNRRAPPRFTYTGADWNPLSYEETVAKETSAVVAYRGSKKFAELEAWKFIEERNPGFDIVTLCPPMTFGPVVHPVASLQELNESNANLWKDKDCASAIALCSQW
jgi:nucleoside-diphosphate-sugar epimerase